MQHLRWDDMLFFWQNKSIEISPSVPGNCDEYFSLFSDILYTKWLLFSTHAIYIVLSCAPLFLFSRVMVDGQGQSADASKRSHNADTKLAFTLLLLASTDSPPPPPPPVICLLHDFTLLFSITSSILYPLTRVWLLSTSSVFNCSSCSFFFFSPHTLHLRWVIGARQRHGEGWGDSREVTSSTTVW